MKRLLIRLSFAFVIASTTACSNITGAKCPSEEQVKSAVKEFIGSEFKVESISKLENIPGLCEIVIKAGAQPIVFYMDGKAEYIMAGNLLSVKDKKNITRERQQEFMKVEKDMLAKLDTMVDITYGQGDKYVYYITDPDCPFCKRTEPILKDWAEKNKVVIKTILFPLPIHPEAFGKSVSLICEKRGFENLMKGEYGNTLCDSGKAKVEQNLDFLSRQLGIGGTPTLIGMNGRLHSGVPTEEDLNKLIK